MMIILCTSMYIVKDIPEVFPVNETVFFKTKFNNKTNDIKSYRDISPHTNICFQPPHVVDAATFCLLILIEFSLFAVDA